MSLSIVGKGLVDMTNEERIVHVCECLLYVIELLRSHDKLFNDYLKLTERELKDIMKDIEQS